jgi:hypothetical protein
MDRPAGQYTYPVAPFDNNLALLQCRLENLDVVSRSNKFQYIFPNELDFYKGADDFILAAIIEHTSEEERMDASRPFFETIFFWERPQIGVQSRIERGVEHQQESV